MREPPQALALGYGGNPYGPAGTGKTESVKALGAALGRQVRLNARPASLYCPCYEPYCPCHGPYPCVTSAMGRTCADLHLERPASKHSPAHK